MFLKKNKLLIIFIFFFTIFLTKNSFSYNEEQKGIIEYLNKLQNFSVFFIQSDGFKHVFNYILISSFCLFKYSCKINSDYA